MATGAVLLSGLLITCCPNIKMSMLWQAGCANYVYSTVWILAFLIVYLRALDPVKKDIPLVHIFFPVLGLMTGWSTENMGPAAAICAGSVTLFCIRKKTAAGVKKIWMIEGVAACVIGSFICILAPGNFVRSSDSIEDLALTPADRIMQMVKGLGDYMFLSLVIFAAACIVYVTVKKKLISVQNRLILMFAVLSYGAMAMSPHYPDRAAFGTCVLLNIVSASLIGSTLEEKKKETVMAVSVLMAVSACIKMAAIITA